MTARPAPARVVPFDRTATSMTPPTPVAHASLAALPASPAAPGGELSLAQLKENDPPWLAKELYIQAQHWTRHNENLIVAANTFLLATIAAATVMAHREVKPDSRWMVFLLPVVVAALGLVFTLVLRLRYRQSVARLIVYEKLLQGHEPCPQVRAALEGAGDFDGKASGVSSEDWGASPSLVPNALKRISRLASPIIGFFLGVHALVAAVGVGLVVWLHP